MAEVDAKVVQQGANEILVFFFTHFDFPNQKFYSANRYIHLTVEGEEGSLFFLAEAVISAVSPGAIGPLAVDENNRSDDTDGNLLQNVAEVAEALQPKILLRQSIHPFDRRG